MATKTNQHAGKLPMITPDRFANWKVRMQVYLDGCNSELFKAIENGPYIPQRFKRVTTTDGSTVETTDLENTPEHEWKEADRIMMRYDKEAKSALFSALHEDMFDHVVNCKTAKDVWQTLEVMYEGTEEVRDNRQNLLIQQYELFNHIPGEELKSTYERFNILVNSLATFGKSLSQKEVALKFMRALPKKFDGKTLAIREANAKTLNDIKLQSLFGNLQTYELEMNQRSGKAEPDVPRKEKGLALVAKKSSSPSSSKDQPEEDDDKEMALLAKRFGRFLRGKGRSNFNNNQGYGAPSSRSSNPKEKDICYNCKKPGHHAIDCRLSKKEGQERSSSNAGNKDKEYYRNKYKGKFNQKVERGLVAKGSWSDSENDSSSEESEDEKAQPAFICLMARDDQSGHQTSDRQTSGAQAQTSGQTSGARAQTSDQALKASVDEVFDFSNPDVSDIELREMLSELSKDYIACCRKIRVLNMEINEGKSRRAELQIEIAPLRAKSHEIDSVRSENDRLRDTLHAAQKRESTLLSQVDEMRKTIKQWNTSSNTVTSIIDSQRQHGDRSGLGLGLNDQDTEKTDTGTLPRSELEKLTIDKLPGFVRSVVHTDLSESDTSDNEDEIPVIFSKKSEADKGKAKIPEKRNGKSGIGFRKPICQKDSLTSEDEDPRNKKSPKTSGGRKTRKAPYQRSKNSGGQRYQTSGYQKTQNSEGPNKNKGEKAHEENASAEGEIMKDSTDVADTSTSRPRNEDEDEDEDEASRPLKKVAPS